jgi:predicted acyltransferase
MPRRTHPARITSLHVLLLLLAIAAVVVDDPSRWARGYGILRHAAWDGLLPADLVTPVFLFFLGAAVPLSERATRRPTLVAIAIALCAAGLALNGIWRADLATWRVTGVLQRAGVTLAIATAANVTATGDHPRRISLLASIAGVITLTYWLVMAHVPPPGSPPGDLSPGVNLAAWLDRVALGPHAWSGDWDPDGILSTGSSIATVLAGLVAGIAIASTAHRTRTIVNLIGAGAGAIVAGILWTSMVPINRSLWSGSFVVSSAGIAAILLGAWWWLAQPPMPISRTVRR